MAVIGRFNSLQVVKHTEFGLYLDGTQHGEILLPKRYVPKDQPSEVGDWLNVFIYLDSDDRLIATTQTPKVQVGGFASLKVVEINRIGLFLDWGLPKDLLLPHSEEKRPLQVGDYCVVYVYLDKRTNRITATARLTASWTTCRRATASARRSTCWWWSVPRWASRRSSRASTGA